MTKQGSTLPLASYSHTPQPSPGTTNLPWPRKKQRHGGSDPECTQAPKPNPHIFKKGHEEARAPEKTYPQKLVAAVQPQWSLELGRTLAHCPLPSQAGYPMPGRSDLLRMQRSLDPTFCDLVRNCPPGMSVYLLINIHMMEQKDTKMNELILAQLCPPL